MEFKQTRSQKEIVKAARDFARSEFDKEQIHEMDKNGDFPHDIQKKAAELGFTSIHFEETYLGGGLGTIENTLMAEELCRKDSTLGSAVMLSSYGADLLNRFGSEELKSRFLSKVAEGEILCGTGATTHAINGTSGSTIPTAIKQDDTWVINGRFSSVLNGGRSGFYIVLCQTNPEGNSTSLILVEHDHEGVIVTETGPTLGLRMTSVADLILEDVQVPLDNTIGRANDGAKMMASFQNDQSVLLAALATGTAQGVLERATDYVKQRDQFGQKIAAFQVTRHKLARMALAIEQSRHLTYRAAWQNDQKKQDPSLSAMAKLSATTAALECAHEAIQLLGGYGFTSEYEVERFCRDAKTLHLMGQNPGALHDEIADTIIGKIK